jgi:hypothetical protein
MKSKLVRGEKMVRERGTITDANHVYDPAGVIGLARCDLSPLEFVERTTCVAKQELKPLVILSNLPL